MAIPTLIGRINHMSAPDGLFAKNLVASVVRSSPEPTWPGVIQLPTGAWYDPEDSDEDAPLCVHGNPNVLTRDVGTSALAQGCTGQLTTVQVELFKGNLPPIKAYDPP
jgi:hypothetical protein